MHQSLSFQEKAGRAEAARCAEEEAELIVLQGMAERCPTRRPRQRPRALPPSVLLRQT